MRFKVGDTVRILSDDSGALTKYNGTIHKIREIDGSMHYMEGIPDNNENGNSCFWWANELELVEDQKFTKENLKTGYIVETRNGHINMVFVDCFEYKGQIIDANSEHKRCSLSDYRDDLTCGCSSQWDIVKVYEASSLVQAFRHFDSNSNGIKHDLNLVWERVSDKEEKLNQVIFELENKLRDAKEELKEIRGE